MRELLMVYGMTDCKAALYEKRAKRSSTAVETSKGRAGSVSAAAARLPWTVLLRVPAG